MKYLNISPFNLHKIDFDNFHYPKLTFSKSVDRNGWNEFEDVVEVYFLGPKVFHLYYSTSTKNWVEVNKEATLFNTDPEKYWTELLIPLLEDQCGTLEESIKAKKRRLKKTKKVLKKLQEKDK